MTKTDWFLILFVFLFGATISLSFLFFGPTFPITGDSEGYNALALNLVSGKGFSLDGLTPHASDVPGYPLFLTAIYKIFGHNYDAVRIIQVLLLAGIGVLIYLIGRRYLGFGSYLAALPAILVVIWPYFVLYTTLILTEITYVFFLIVAVISLLEFHRSFSKKSATAAGISLAAASLIRPVVFFLPVWLIFFYLLFKRNKGIIKKQLLLIIIFVLAMSPWTIRNFIHFHEFIPTADLVFPGIAAIFVKDAGDTYYEAFTEKPAEALKSRINNFVLFWNPGTQGTRAQKLLEIDKRMEYFFLVYKITFFSVLFLAFLSLFYFKRKEIFLLWCIIFYFWCLHALFSPYPRYTFPIIPLVILLAIFASNKLIERLKIQRSS